MSRSVNFRFAVIVLILQVGCTQPTSETSSEMQSDYSSADLQTLEEQADLAADVQMFCGDCHMAPNPATFPKRNWPGEVEQGFEFYRSSGRTDLHPPQIEQVTKFYQALAPDSLELPEPEQIVNEGPVRFTQMEIASPRGRTKPGVSHILADRGELVISDMISGDISRVRFDGRKPEIEVMSTESHPAHAEILDLGGIVNLEGTDGRLLAIAELGSFSPADHSLGAVILCAMDQGKRRNVVLDGVGRVADVKAGDFNGDQKLDLVVAEFGWHDTGGLHLLINRSDGEELNFEDVVLDPRHGFSHLRLVDLNGDNCLDFVALVSQEHEQVIAFVNDGQGEFRQEALFHGPVPDYGCSSIDVADVDGDGDMDVLLTNGDSMDSLLLKPHHGVQWLENLGGWQFKHRRLGAIPGVYGGRIGDLDGDGDQDIVACAMTWWDDLPFNSVVWFEQLTPREFRKHALDISVAQHACLELGDFDGDGAMDIAVGEFHKSKAMDTWFSVWWNDGPRKE